MFDSFIDSLPEKVRCTDNFEIGTKFRKKSDALNFKYIEISQFLKKQIIIDIDRAGSAYDYQDKNLPTPSWITINPENAHCHYCYELNTAVVYTEAGRRAPQRYFEAVDLALTTALNGDPAYIGRITKNPLHPAWKIIRNPVQYDLEDFTEYIELPKRKKLEIVPNGEGRNTTLFNHLRLWAYQEVKQHDSFQTFQSMVDDRALAINLEFNSWESGNLSAKEVLSTAKSVSNWTWKHKNSIHNQIDRGVMNLPETMSLEDKQTASAYYSNEVRKKTTLEIIIESAKALKAQGTPITQQAVSIHSKCSLRSVKSFWKQVENNFNLYRYSTT